jgi:hypothetical protein
MPRRAWWKRRALIRIYIGIALLAAILIVWDQFPWLIREHDIDVDLQTGRIRETRYVLCIPIKKQIIETPLSLALPANERDAARPDWQRALTFHGTSGICVGGQSEKAPTQIHTLGILWQLNSYAPEAREKMARTVLRIWQRGDYHDVSKYLDSVDALAEKVASKRGTTRPINADELPEGSR